MAQEVVEGSHRHHRGQVREIALPLGYLDLKVRAVDDVWSGLKLVVRQELRSKGAR